MIDTQTLVIALALALALVASLALASRVANARGARREIARLSRLVRESEARS